jgi:hypothetical protein
MNVSVERWVDLFPEGRLTHSTQIRSGFLNSQLLLPCTDGGEFCLPLHGIFSPTKYRGVEHSFTSALVNGCESTISQGVLFLGIANYWHFLMDGLATVRGPWSGQERIYFRKEVPQDWVEFLLAFLKYKFPNSIFSAHVIPEGLSRLKDIRCPWVGSLDGRLKNLIALVNDLKGFIPPKSHGGHSIWVSRSSASYRRLVNESELIEIARSHLENLIVMDPSTLTLRRQIEFFANADYVIGPHGAGLTNAIFSNRLKGVIELWHSYKQPFFRVMAGSIESDYQHIEGVSVPTGASQGRQDNEDFVVSPEHLSKMLSKISKR